MSTTRSAVSVSERLGFLATPRARQVIGVAAFALLTAISAKIAVPLPGTSVPFTFQPLAVMLAGALLGARLGAASQITYLTVGIIGIPVFFGPVAGIAYLAGPTGGYLIAYPLAAAVVGALTGGSMARAAFGLVAGLSVIYLGGVAWLAALGDWSTAVVLGLAPFVVADLVKAGLALLVAARLRDRSRAFFNA